MKEITVSVNPFGVRAVDADDKFICFYTVKDGEPTIITPNDSDEYELFFESMVDQSDFKVEKVFYVSHFTSIYNLVKDCMYFHKECI